MGESLKDPVCGAAVLPGRVTAVYLGVEYSFCSAACRDRFLAYPHLYAGLRGQRWRRRAGPPASGADEAPPAAAAPTTKGVARNR